MLWIRPAALRVRIVLPPTDSPKALPSHSRYVFGPSTVSCVKTSLSYALPVEAAKTIAMVSTPAHGLLRTEAWSTGFATKAAANSGVPLFRTIAIQSLPGWRAEGSTCIGVSSISGDASGISGYALRRCHSFGGGADHVDHETGIGKHGDMAAGDLKGGRAHAFRNEAFEIGMDGTVLGGHDVPAGLRSPSGALDFLIEKVRGRRALRRPHEFLLLLGQVSREAHDAVRLQPDAPVRNFNVRKHISGGKLGLQAL